jgi:ribose 5-phosphate isomerase B
MVENFSKKRNIFIGSDHAGFILKSSLIDHLSNFDVIDMGAVSSDPVDYPDIASMLCEKLESDENAIGILICGTGIGMSIAANRHSHIRAALCHNPYDAQMAREHNDANIICLGARVVGDGLAKACVDMFLSIPFSSKESHRRRIMKLV